VSKQQPFSLSSIGEAVKSSKGQVRGVGWVGDNSHVVFGQKFPGEKGSVRWCIVVVQQPLVLSPKFRAKSAHFHTVAVKRHSSMRN
jgi:hypothetical protein